jgi:hypothetical protein
VPYLRAAGHVSPHEASQHLSTELVSSERPSTEPLSTESLSTETEALIGKGSFQYSGMPVSVLRKLPVLSEAASLSTLSVEERGEWFRAVARDEQLALAQMRAMGLPDDVELGERFWCWFHPIENGEKGAALFRATKSKEVVYRDLHLPGAAGFLTLPDVRYSLVFGQPKKLSRSARIYWRLRLMIEADVLDPARIELPGLPLDAPPAVEKTYDGLALALKCRWKLDAGEPIPFSRSFALPWCGLRDETQARFAIEWLIERKVVARVGELPSKNPARRPTALFLPAHLAPNWTQSR